MTRRRRVFDIELPADPGAPSPGPDPAADTRRPGPMAAAIQETAGALRSRHEIETAIRAENDALAHEHVRLKGLGLVLEEVPLDLIDTARLIRDRQPGPDPDLPELAASIADVGLSNPIRVEAAEGRFELIQGWRRLAAYRHLRDTTGDAARWGMIPARVLRRGAALETLYRQMVDENMVRRDVSFAEMALLARGYAAETGTDPDAAVAALFRSAGYQKRSYIRAFLRLMDRIGDALDHAPAIPRALGLALAARLDADPSLAAALVADLDALPDRDPAGELAVLRRHADAAPPSPAVPSPSPSSPRVAPPAHLRLSLPHAGRAVSVSVKADRVEIRVPDLPADPARIEAAIQAFLDRLEHP